MRDFDPTRPFEGDDELIAWAVDTMARLTDVLRPRVKGLIVAPAVSSNGPQSA